MYKRQVIAYTSPGDNNPSDNSTHSPSSTGTCDANVVADSEVQEGATLADVLDANGTNGTNSRRIKTAMTCFDCMETPSFHTLSMMRQLVLNPSTLTQF